MKAVHTSIVVACTICVAVLGVFAVWRIYTPGSLTSDYADWKTYTDPMTGFSVSYPPQYEARGGFTVIDGLMSSDLVIADPSDTSTYEFHAVPMHVLLQTQPIGEGDEVYHTIAQYQQSSVAAEMAQGATNPKGDQILINGEQALMYYFPKGDAEEAATYAYFFIKNDELFQIFFNADGPYMDPMLHSIAFVK